MGACASVSRAAGVVAGLHLFPCAFAAMVAAQEPTARDEASAREEVCAQLTVAGRDLLQFQLFANADRLLAKDATVRTRAAVHLQVLMEELSKHARQVGTSDRNEAYAWQSKEHELRLMLSRTLGELPLAGSPEAAPVAMWLWRHAGDGEERAKAAYALTSVRTPEVDSLLLSIAVEGGTVPWAVCYALEQLAVRNLTVAPEVLHRLGHHYDDGVRRRAAKVAADRGLEMPEVGRDDVVLGATVERWLEVARSLATSPPPATAPWIELHGASTEAGGSEFIIPGWLLQEGGGDDPLRILTSYGATLEFDGDSVDRKAASWEQHVASLLADRERYARTQDLAERQQIEQRHGLRRFMHSSGDIWRGSPSELLAAAWSLTRGDRAAAVRLLSPALRGAWDARDYLQPLLDELASQMDEAMLAAFADGRDYGKAREMASRLVVPELADFRHQGRARELLRQLPLRGDDFLALQLPTVEQWQEIERTRSRSERIEHLVARLRLLNCHQIGNPGWLSYDQEQSGRPYAVWSQKGVPGDVRVNPFCALLGMNLAADELPALLPALESRDYILAYDLERFLPQRPQQLHRVAFVAASICNEVAQASLVDPAQFLGEPSARKAAREQLLAYCDAHRGERTADRLMDRMREAEDWQQVRRAFWNLHGLDPVRAAMVIRELGRQQPERMPQIVRLLSLLDRSEFLGEARDWMRSDDPDTRFFAAALLLRHRQEAESAFATIRDRLQGGAADDLAPAAVEPLLACDLPAAKALLVDMLAGKYGLRPTPGLMQRLLRAGYQEAFAALDQVITANIELSPDLDAETRLHLLVQFAAWWPDVDVRWLDARDAERLETLSRQMRDRLRADWQRITDKQAPLMRPASLELPWGELRTYSSGWIRRL